MKIKEALKSFNNKAMAAMLIAAITISLICGAKAAKAWNNSNDTIDPVIVQAMNQDIKKTISATGTIISAEESTEFATAGGSYPVAEVYVKVGDQVKKGDPLYRLDMKTLEQQLSYQQQALDIQNQQNAINTDNANKALQDAKDAGAIQVLDANRSLEQAKQDKVAADRNQSNSNSTLNSSRDAEGDARRALDSANSAVNNAQSKVNEISNKINALEPDSDEKDQLVKELESAKATLSSAQAERDSKKTALDSAISSRQSAEQSLQSAKDSASTASRQAQSAQISADDAQKKANNTIISQAQAVKLNELSSKASTLSQQQEIAKTKEELGKNIVYASQDGTVTNVNIKSGQTYGGTDAVVIDNVTNLLATADIDEAQIPNIEVGQKVEIKTDATGDEVLYGTVKFVSPTATKNSNKAVDGTSSTASVSKTRATYRVDVSIEGTNKALRLGMTAKMTFITANKSGVLTVPSSDIQTNADGSKYVVVQKADGTTENVKVETGLSDDFFTEITGGSLKEGANIVESVSDGSSDAVLDSMGADGGIYD